MNYHIYMLELERLLEDQSVKKRVYWKLMLQLIQVSVAVALYKKTTEWGGLLSPYSTATATTTTATTTTTTTTMTTNTTTTTDHHHVHLLRYVSRFRASALQYFGRPPPSCVRRSLLSTFTFVQPVACRTGTRRSPTISTRFFFFSVRNIINAPNCAHSARPTFDPVLGSPTRIMLSKLRSRLAPSIPCTQTLTPTYTTQTPCSVRVPYLLGGADLSGVPEALLE